MASTLTLEIVTPDRKFFEDEVEKVVVRGLEGDIGVLRNHIPLVTPLAIGRVKIKQNGEYRIAAVAEGYLDITETKTTIVTDAAEWPDEIDLNRAELAKQRAEEKLKKKDKNIDYDRAEIALRKAINRINVAKRG
ncbi:F0F1 ATP synthase subunit epsilon [Clostridium sp. D2Q-11]|uniref:ATP synthase epsilon chain n=1 Tax=Anaeromonas frigoriresistens TaxID=2683708 RepID=A0A942UUN6_9FIRM|nr:F0F1 ATP synthase subunit epsilon [Anaeromonas frigoriresistens]MBS4538320.1 F0F1 ATP synthase subunit epsilon [Anaeromonas frigoriresistens]